MMEEEKVKSCAHCPECKKDNLEIVYREERVYVLDTLHSDGTVDKREGELTNDEIILIECFSCQASWESVFDFFEDLEEMEDEDDEQGRLPMDNFRVVNNAATGGSHLQGEIICSYSDLVKAFGQPGSGDEYKVDAKWEIVFDDGLIATIYNYKTGKNYNGPSGLIVEKIRDWHIGGFEKEVVERICRILDLA